jgi:hypothetical protein
MREKKTLTAEVAEIAEKKLTKKILRDLGALCG